MPTSTQPQVHLRWSEKDRRVVVETEDEDRFCTTVEDVIEACRVYDKENRKLFQIQIRYLLDILGEWGHQHREVLDRAFLTVRDGQLLFLVVTKERIYNAPLEKDLTKLDFEIARKSDLSEICLTVQSLPQCGSRGFMSFCRPGVMFELKGLHAE